MTSTHLLIVGGGRSLPDLARKCDPNVRISIICRHDSVRRYPDLDMVAHLVSLPADADISTWVAAARFLHELKPLDGLLVMSEQDMAHASEIGVALGLRAPARRTVDAVDHKDLMRAVLAAADVDATPARKVSCPEELTAFADEVGYPLICKPAQGVGSQGVSRLDSAADIPAAMAWATAGTEGLASTAILVEPFHEGTEYSVECISEAGRHLVGGITAKFSEPGHFVELGHIVPAPIPTAEAERIAATVTAALGALGVTDGVTHTEVIATGSAVHIVETHLRPAGDRIPDMLARARGIDLLELSVRQALGEEVLVEAEQLVAAGRTTGSYAAIWHACPEQKGTLTDVRGVADAAGLPGVCEVKLRAEIGQELGALAESRSRAAHVWAVGDTPEEALARAKAGVDRLVFVIDQPV